MFIFIFILRSQVLVERSVGGRGLKGTPGFVHTEDVLPHYLQLVVKLSNDLWIMSVC